MLQVKKIAHLYTMTLTSLQKLKLSFLSSRESTFDRKEVDREDCWSRNSFHTTNFILTEQINSYLFLLESIIF